MATLRFLHAWELGAGLGHLGVFSPLARQLTGRGHEVTLAARETATVDEVARDLRLRVVQAPFLSESAAGAPPLSYSDILTRYGLAKPAVLRGHVAAWRGLFELTRPQLLIADHAPAALVAARSAGLPVMLFNSGFFVPPPVHPLPALRPWQAAAPATLAAIDRALLDSINTCLDDYGAPTIGAVAHLFEVAEPTLLGFPEFDHYDRQGRIAYWGYTGTAGVGDAPRWPEHPGQRIFAYLRAGMAHLAATVGALIRAGQPTLLYCPDLPEDLAHAIASCPHIVHTRRPLDLDRVIPQADLLVSYAAFATTTAFVHAGKPTLMIPRHLEQYLFARRVEDAGCGLVVSPEGPGGDIDGKLHALLSSPACAQHCAAFRQRYAAFPQDLVVSNILRRMLELAAATAGAGA